MAKASPFDPTALYTDSQRARWLWEDARKVRRALDESIGRELEFGLEQAHWRLDPKDEIDPRRIRPKDETLYRRIRYLAGSIQAQPLFFQGLPTDPSHTLDQTEVAASVVEYLMTNPLNRFEVVLSKAIWGALAARMWVIGHDYSDYSKSIVYRSIDPRLCFWTPGYDDPHDPLCPWFIEESYVPLDQVIGRKGWKNTRDLAPDNGKPTASEGAPNPYGDGRAYLPTFSSSQTMDKTRIPHITIIKCWYKHDYRKQPPPTDDAPPLPDGERYMACPQCGYQSAQESESADPMPPMIQSGCPDCHSDIYRIDTHGAPSSTLTYPAGQSLVISAPFQPEGEQELYNGGWPNTREGYRIRSFPYTPIYFGESPNRPCGLSEVSLMKDRQIIINVLLRHGYEQLSNAKLLTVVPRVGLEDFQGQAFAFTDEQGHVAFKTTEYTGDNKIEYVQAPGVVSGLGQFYEIVTGSSRSNEGTSELGMAPGQSKDIAVGTIQELVKTGNVPIDDKVKMLHRQLAMLAMTSLDHWRCVNADKSPVRLKAQDGSYKVHQLSSFDVVAADIVLTGTPAFDGLTNDRMDAWQKLIASPKIYRNSMMHAFRFPPSVVRSIQKDEADSTPPPIDPQGKILTALAQISKVDSIPQDWIVQAAAMAGIKTGPPNNGATNGPNGPAPGVAGAPLNNGGPLNVPTPGNPVPQG